MFKMKNVTIEKDDNTTSQAELSKSCHGRGIGLATGVPL
jgi:hypothetical protein